MKKLFSEKMKANPIIAGVKDINNLEDALNSECEIIFLLCGTIFNLKEIVQKAKDKNKIIFIHVDLVDGFSKDATALKYINDEIRPDGIISTKNSQLKVAKSLGMLTVQRIFIIDSLSIETAVKASQMINPDAIEIMPGIMPRITKQLSSSLDVPVIVGGLISEKEEVLNAIESGALGVSTSAKTIWEMKL
ncbi:MAG: glycerol-3-phosphate responsive antiterminator [Clostridia bacterium]|nr:glycerol-3-phosphate responsive antiterminator [Clostridia bacterium]